MPVASCPIVTGDPSPNMSPASFGSRSITSLWHSDAAATLMRSWSFEGTGNGTSLTEILFVLLMYCAALCVFGSPARTLSLASFVALGAMISVLSTVYNNTEL